MEPFLILPPSRADRTSSNRLHEPPFAVSLSIRKTDARLMPSVAAIERNEIGENDPTQPLAEVHGLLLSK
jgi:hypothetical protein